MLRIDLVGLLKAKTVLFLSGLTMTLMLPACKTDAAPKMRASIQKRYLHIVSLDDKPFTIIGVIYNRGNRDMGILKQQKWEALTNQWGIGLGLSEPEQCEKTQGFISPEMKKPFLAETKSGKKACAWFRTLNFGDTTMMSSIDSPIEVEVETDRGTVTFKFQ